MKNLDFYAGYHLFPTKYYLTFYARPFFEKTMDTHLLGKVSSAAYFTLFTY